MSTKFFRRRRIWMPTWPTCLLGMAGAGIVAILLLRNVYGLLAVHSPLPEAELLVVEGWADDYAIAEALDEFRRHPCKALCVTGGPMERGAPLSQYKTYAELGAANLRTMGCDAIAVPAPAVARDRTYASALALRQWLAAHEPAVSRINVVSQGPHSRRTRLLFEKVFAPTVRIGMVDVPEQSYDPRRWWTSSSGFRAVTDEFIAYFYARFFFRPT